MTDQKPPKPDTTKTETPSQKEETGGPKGPEPTRYNDWEKNGKCVDF